MEEGFSSERKPWRVIDKVQNLASKKTSVQRHETWETHSKMSLPGIVFIINRVFNKLSVYENVCLFSHQMIF